MQFEDQSTAIRQMKELLKDQSKFRAKLDRVVRKIETSSQRTAKLAERNKLRAKAAGDGNGNGSGNGNGHVKGNGKMKKSALISAVESNESQKLHGDKLNAFTDDAPQLKAER